MARKSRQIQSCKTVPGSVVGDVPETAVVAAEGVAVAHEVLLVVFGGVLGLSHARPPHLLFLPEPAPRIALSLELHRKLGHWLVVGLPKTYLYDFVH